MAKIVNVRAIRYPDKLVFINPKVGSVVSGLDFTEYLHLVDATRDGTMDQNAQQPPESFGMSVGPLAIQQDMRLLAERNDSLKEGKQISVSTRNNRVHALSPSQYGRGQI